MGGESPPQTWSHSTHPSYWQGSASARYLEKIIHWPSVYPLLPMDQGATATTDDCSLAEAQLKEKKEEKKTSALHCRNEHEQSQ